MKNLLLTLSLSVFPSIGFAQQTAPVPPKASTQPFIAQGETVEIPDAGFTITPPVGWEVIRDGSGASLLFQGPKPVEVPGVITYRPNIRIMMFPEQKPMDDSTKEEFSKIIMDRFSAISNRISGYNVRSAERITLASGIPAYLYYAEFNYDSTPTMQMHILVSSGTKHFLMTYTDLAKVFEEEKSVGLATAYTSLQGIKLDSAPDDRFFSIYIALVVIGALILFLCVIRLIRGYRMKRLADRVESEEVGEGSIDEDGESYSPRSSLTHHEDSSDRSEKTEVQSITKPKVPAKPVRPMPPHAPSPVLKQSAQAVSSHDIPAPVFSPRPGSVVTEPATIEPKARAEALASPVAPQSGTWNLKPSAMDDTHEDAMSEVSEIKVKPGVVTATKAKHQKIKPSSKPMNPSEGNESDFEVSKVARLSEILPHTGEPKKKKKGFFGWRKEKAMEDDGAMESSRGESASYESSDKWGADEDTGIKVKANDKAKAKVTDTKVKKNEGKKDKAIEKSFESQPASGVSHIAEGGWNLSEGTGHSESEDDDD